MSETSYLIALGSNRRTRFGSPAATLRALLSAPFGSSMPKPRTAQDIPPSLGLSLSGGISLQLPTLLAASRVVTTTPVGPARRAFANAAAIVRSPLDPPALLAQLKAIERALGRRRGRRWGDRPLDLDIILWSGGAWDSPGLTIPHPAFRDRGFVLGPAARIAPRWRDPLTGLRLRHLYARHLQPRLTRRPPAHR